jgi:predicted metalloendopeptidase
LAENIADAGGLNIAFHAYQNYVKKMGKPEKTLPGFEHLTPEQLFFVSHGLFTCSVVKKSDAQILIVSSGG